MYGEVQLSERHNTWSFLKFIRCHRPHCCGFVLVMLIKFYINRSMWVFRKGAGLKLRVTERWLMFVASMTLGLRVIVGPLRKKFAGGSYCPIRLDRGLANADWCSRFPHAKVKHLAAAASDHVPIVL